MNKTWEKYAKHFKDDPIFTEIFEKGDLSNLTREELDRYAPHLKAYRDLKNVIDYAYEQGLKQGQREAYEEAKLNGEFKMKQHVAKSLKEHGYSISDISRLVELPDETLKDL